MQEVNAPIRAELEMKRENMKRDFYQIDAHFEGYQEQFNENSKKIKNLTNNFCELVEGELQQIDEDLKGFDFMVCLIVNCADRSRKTFRQEKHPSARSKQQNHSQSRKAVPQFERARCWRIQSWETHIFLCVGDVKTLKCILTLLLQLTS